MKKEEIKTLAEEIVKEVDKTTNDYDAREQVEKILIEFQEEKNEQSKPSIEYTKC